MHGITIMQLSIKEIHVLVVKDSVLAVFVYLGQTNSAWINVYASSICSK